jgi:hypothetical protein
MKVDSDDEQTIARADQGASPSKKRSSHRLDASTANENEHWTTEKHTS